jgi:hypothetical protein
LSSRAAEHDAAFVASSLSREFFFENFYHIPVVGKGAELFKLRDYQRDVCDSIDDHYLNIGLKARQIGWTTIGVAYALHDAMFNPHRPWMFVSRTEDAAQKMLAKAIYSYNRIPKWLRDMLPRVTNQTQSVLAFENGSYIESVPATNSTGRGDAVYGVLMDECAFMEYAEGIWGAVEPLCYGKAMLFSTANGMGNFFHEVWLDSTRDDSAWNGIFFPWSVVESRDQGWYDSTRRSFRGREWLFYQEYPSSPEEAFAKSGRVAFQAEDVLACFEDLEPENRYEWVIGGTPRRLEAGQEADIEFTVWREPRVERDDRGNLLRKPNYVVSADIAEGLEHGDFTYVTVFDCNANDDGRFEQVASCKSSIPVAYLDEFLEWLGYYYHRALIVAERNNAGIMPLEKLGNDRWYPRLYRMDRYAEIPSNTDRTARYGWYTDRKSKPKMVNDFVLALGERQVLLHDYDFVVEAQVFVADGKGSYAATSNNHDDVIMGTLVGWQGVMDSPKYPIQFRDSTTRAITHQDMDDLSFVKVRKDNPMEKALGQDVPVRTVDKGLLFAKGNLL